MKRGPLVALALAGCVLAAAAGVARARAGVAVACPDGTVRAEARPPAGREQWCERRGPVGRPVRHGPYRAWYPDGRLKIEGGFDDGVKAGRWTFWHGNGIASGVGQKKEEGEYRAGREHGHWTRWHSLGPRREEGEYRAGVREGRWTFWTEVGRKMREGEYRDGQEIGPWLRWSPNGEACPALDQGRPVPPSDDRAGVSA